MPAGIRAVRPGRHVRVCPWRSRTRRRCPRTQPSGGWFTAYWPCNLYWETSSVGWPDANTIGRSSPAVRSRRGDRARFVSTTAPSSRRRVGGGPRSATTDATTARGVFDRCDVTARCSVWLMSDRCRVRGRRPGTADRTGRRRFEGLVRNMWCRLVGVEGASVIDRRSERMSPGAGGRRR